MRRCLRLWKNAHPLNLARSSEELVDYTKYKRHFVPRINYKQRVELGDSLPKLSPYESYMKAMNETFPTIEKSIEEDILTHYKDHLTPQEQFELEMAWKRRQQVTDETARKPREYISQPEEPQPDNIEMLEKGMFLKAEELANLTMRDVGRYVEIPEVAARVVFRNGLCGRYMLDDFRNHRLFAFMIREETVKIIDGLKMNQNVQGSQYHESARKHNAQFLSTLVGLQPYEQLSKLIENDLSTYFLLMNRTSNLLNELISEKKDPEIDMLFRNSPDLFDVATNLIVWKYPVPEVFNYIFKADTLDFATMSLETLSGLLNAGRGQIKEILDSFVAFCRKNLTVEDMKGQVSMYKIREHIGKSIELRFGTSSVTIDMTGFKKWEDYHPRPEVLNSAFPKYSGFNGTTVLTGPSGTGKSNVLTVVALWAIAEGSWVVIKVPRASDITRNPSTMIWHTSGLYLQPEVAFDILADFESANKDKLEHIPVKSEFYGKYNVAGLHDIKDKEYVPLPAQHKWLEHLQVFSDDWRKFYDEESLLEMEHRVTEGNLPPRHSRIDYEIGVISEMPIPPDIEKQIASNADDDAEQLKRTNTTPPPDNQSESEEEDLLKSKPMKRLLAKMEKGLELSDEEGEAAAAEEEEDKEERDEEQGDEFSDVEPEELVLANSAAKKYPRKIKNPKSGEETLIYRDKMREIFPQDLALREKEEIEEEDFQNMPSSSDSDAEESAKTEETKGNNGDNASETQAKTASPATKEAKSAGKSKGKLVASAKSSSSESSSDSDSDSPQREADLDMYKFADFDAEEDPLATVATRMTTHLPAPKTLQDIVTFGLRNHVYSTNAICEVLEQLQHMDNFNSLVLVDEFSDFFKPTMQPSAKYANYKEMGSCIPSSDLALGRAFMRLDGHRFKNGAKVVASSEFKDPKKTFDFKKVDVLPHYMMNVEPMTLNDFRMMCVFYKSSGFLSAMFSEQDIQVAYMHSQGNWRCAHQILRSYVPIHF